MDKDNNNNINSYNHSINLLERKTLVITGVKKIENFDNVHFLEYEGVPITEKNILRRSKDISADKDAQLTAYNEAIIQTQNRFHLNGHIRLLLPIPDSSNLETGIDSQLFAYMESRDDYFTERSNYHSYLVLYTYSGKGTLRYKNQEYCLHPGDGFWIDCREPHYYATKNNTWTHFDYHFSGKTAISLYKEFITYGTPLFSESQSNSFLMQLYEELASIWDSANYYRHLQLSGKTLEMLTYILTSKRDISASTSDADQFTFLIYYLRHNFQYNITLDYLSSFTNISKYHLVRKFKKYTGFTPIEYIIELRIKHAQQLLIGTNLSINEIAAASGFANMNNFINQFKKRVKMTPSQYRKS